MRLAFRWAYTFPRIRWQGERTVYSAVIPGLAGTCFSQTKPISELTCFQKTIVLIGLHAKVILSTNRGGIIPLTNHIGQLKPSQKSGMVPAKKARSNESQTRSQHLGRHKHRCHLPFFSFFLLLTHSHQLRGTGKTDAMWAEGA